LTVSNIIIQPYGEDEVYWCYDVEEDSEITLLEPGIVQGLTSGDLILVEDQ
jgi:hypothetical protein